MTQRVFHTDAYCRTFEADVIRTDEERGGVVLDRTCFYPGGGGQPHDMGLLSAGDWVGKITTLEKHGEDVLHRVDGSLPQPGTQVHGTVDWERRYSLMQTHTALHILCGIIWHEFGRLSTGCDMKPGAAHIDFELDTVDQGMTTHLQRRIDEEVAASRPIHVRTLTRSEAEDVPDLVRTKVNLLPKNLESIRIVEIEGLDLQADGGTHVANTSEVGTVRIVRTKSKGRHNKRLYLEVG